MLNHAAQEKCERCHDTGLVHLTDPKGYTRLYRCYCEAGNIHSGMLFAPKDKEKAHPIEIPLCKPDGGSGRC